MDDERKGEEEKPISVFLPANILMTRNARIEAERRLLEYDTLTRFASLWCACVTTALAMLAIFSDQVWLPFVSAASAVIMTITIFYATSRNYSEQAARMRMCYTELQGLSIEASRLLSEGGSDLEERMADLGQRYVEVLKRSDNHTKKDYLRASKEREEKSKAAACGDERDAICPKSKVPCHNRSFYLGIMLIVGVSLGLLVALALVFILIR